MAEINGSDLNDILRGGGGSDVISALAGSDTVSGANGDDELSGGEGRDVMRGGRGADTIYGFGASDMTPGSGDILLQQVATGLGTLVFACSAPGDPDRLFAVEKGGIIKIVDVAAGTVRADPFLDVSGTVIDQGEQGLLGLAFHPDYDSNGIFFVNAVNLDGDIEVRRYTRSAADPDVADPDSGDVILTIPHPVNDNHNGGWMAFGPDGYLYVSVGDGGGSGDPNNNAQNKSSLLGKMLRIDVDGDDFAADDSRDYAIPDGNPFLGVPGANEIWALGLRNPWRSSFDRLTGDLYIGDVGQGRREEINFQSAESAGGENYGWKVKEGTLIFNDTDPRNPHPDSPELIDPVIEYGHVPAPDGGNAVTGGYVYRGTGPGMQGTYFYADFSTRQLWSFRMVEGEVVDAINRTEQLVLSGVAISGISSFAEDGHGNLYVISIAGRIHRLTPQVGAGDGSDTLRGGAGDDTIYGGAGGDVLAGGGDDDELHGGSQNDTLNGGGGNDELSGDAGGDRLTGNAGIDLLAGGSGADTFVFRGGFGQDTVTDFTDDQDTILLGRNLGVTTIAEALARATDVSGDVVFAFAGGETLTVANATKAQLADDLQF